MKEVEAAAAGAVLNPVKFTAGKSLMQQQLIADAAAASSVAAAGWTWVANVNGVLQIVATLIAIVAGVYAIQWHRFRLMEGKRHLDRKERKKQIEETIKETEK